MTTPARTDRAPKQPEAVPVPLMLATCDAALLMVTVQRGTPAQVEARHEAALAYIGIPIGTLSPEQVALPHAFTDAVTGSNPAHTTRDALLLIETIRTLALTPNAPDTEPRDLGVVTHVSQFRLGNEGDAPGSSATAQFMVPVGGRTDSERNAHMRCAEAADAVWPRLLEILAASIGGTAHLDPDQDTDFHTVDLNRGHCPEMVRLKSGWDIDGAGNQIWLTLEEAWRRLMAANDRERARRKMDEKRMRKMRKHMEGFFADVPTGGTLKPEAAHESNRR